MYLLVEEDQEDQKKEEFVAPKKVNVRLNAIVVKASVIIQELVVNKHVVIGKEKSFNEVVVGILIIKTISEGMLEYLPSP